MSDFFSQLVDFLPKYVSPLPTYLHSGIAFVAVMLIGHLVSEMSSFSLDIDGDGKESQKENRMKKIVFFGGSAIVGMIVADVTYDVSWRLRNRTNINHLTYSRWFPSIYQSK